MFNESLRNPSSILSAEKNSITSFYRTQWRGIDGAPKTLGLIVGFPNMGKKTGISVMFMKEYLANYNHNRMEVDYAYRINFDEHKVLLGLKFIGGNTNLSLQNLHTPVGNITDDAVLVGLNNNSWYYNFGVGTRYQFNDFIFDVALLNISTKAKSYKSNLFPQELEFNSGLRYDYTLNSTFSVLPSLTYVTNGNIHKINVNVNVEIHDVFLTGISYRSFDSVSMLLGYKLLDDYAFYYSYDVGINKIGAVGVSGGSHEITLKYYYNITKKMKKIKTNRNVRFL